jgi:hypothetical protein
VRRIGSNISQGSDALGADDFAVDFHLDLPPYEPTPKPPSTPQEFVNHALTLARSYDPKNLGGQSRALESIAKMHLEQGRNETGLLAMATADRLMQQHIRGGGNLMDQFSFYGRASRTLKEMGLSQAGAAYHAKQVELMNRR